MTAPAPAPATAFRPRTVSEIADAGIQLVRRQTGAFFTLSTIVSIPSLILGVLVARLLPDPAAIAAGGAGGDPTAMFENAGPLFLLYLAAWCWTFVAYGALVAMADDTYHARPAEPGGALRRALGRAGALIGGSILAYLRVLVAILVLGIVAGVAIPVLGGRGASGPNAVGILVGVALVLLMIGWTFYILGRYVVNVTPAVITEGLGPVAAVRRAGALSAGSVGRILGLVLLLGVVGLIVFVAIFMIVGVVIGDRQELAGPLTTVALIPLMPFFAAMITVMYYDLRIRKEGYDVELMASQLAGPPPAAGAVR